MHRQFWRVVVIILAGVGLTAGLRATVAAQATAPGQDVLPALLTEVRALRVAMEQMAAVGPRIQLAMGRLTMQDQRVNTLQRRHQEIRSGLTGAETSLEEQRRMLTQLETTAQDSSRTGQEKGSAEEQIKNIRSQIAGTETLVQQLRSEEATISSDLATEQARWNEINQRLDELERALTRR